MVNEAAKKPPKPWNQNSNPKTPKKDLEAPAIFERSKVVTRFWKFRCKQHDPCNPQPREKAKHVRSTHSLFLGSYPKFRDSFGSAWIRILMPIEFFLQKDYF